MNYRIQSITVEGLFGMFDHHIPLNQKERITIVYGVNGIGKTMIMRMVDALMKQEFWKLEEIPFDTIKISFTNDSYLILKKKSDKSKFRHLHESNITYRTKSNEENSLNILLTPSQSYINNRLINLVNYITNKYSNWHKVGAKSMYNSNLGITIQDVDFIKAYQHLVTPEFIYTYDIPKELSNLLESIKTYFIPTQRMSIPYIISNDYTQYYGIPSDSTIDAVIGCSHALASKINDAKNKYNDEANKLDSSLSKRLLDREVNTNYSYEQLTQQAEAIKVRQNQLRTVGLVNGMVGDDFMPDKSMNDINKAIIAVNFQDIQLKLGVFDDIYEKLKLFVNTLNNNRLSFKKIQISSEHGFVFKNDNGVAIKPDQLSSGEQHELIMLYLFLFEVPENALVMIDEPEISHHIMWQKSFVNDMLEIIKLRNFDVYVNTHSPSIVNGNWDMTIPLREEELVEEN